MGAQLRRVCLIFYDEDEDPFNEYHYLSGHSLPVASTASGSDPRPPDTHRPAGRTSEAQPQPLNAQDQDAEASCQPGDRRSHVPCAPAGRWSRQASPPRPPPAWPQQGQLFWEQLAGRWLLVAEPFSLEPDRPWLMPSALPASPLHPAASSPGLMRSPLSPSLPPPCPLSPSPLLSPPPPSLSFPLSLPLLLSPLPLSLPLWPSPLPPVSSQHPLGLQQ